MIEHLRPQDLNCNVFSIDDYDYEDMTIQELLNTFFTKINECVDVSNESLNYLEWLKGQGLRAETIKVLNEWFTNGKLGELIKEEVLGDFEKRISANETTIQEHTHDIADHLTQIQRNHSDIATNTQHIQDNLNSINQHNTRITKAEERLTGLTTEMINLIYPVGSVIQLTNDTDPNRIYSGTTWVKIEGKFLVGKSSESEFNQLGKTGGEKKVTLTKATIPSHYHDGLFLDNTSSGDGSQTGLGYGDPINLGWSSPTTQSNSNLSFNQSPQQYDRQTGAIITGHTGGSEAHENLPPYEVVAIWKRTV